MNFLCFDGETLNNKYILLGNNINHIYNESGLTSKQCLDFIWNEVKGKSLTKFIIFRIGYDLTFWIKDIPENLLVGLFKAKEITYGEYKLRYFENKFLIIRKGNRVIYIYDIYSYFQKSLLKVIELLKVNLTKEQKDILDLGKKERETEFSNMDIEQIIFYNKTECVISSKIADIIFKLTKESFFLDATEKYVNLVTKDFYGSSAISSKILNAYNIEKQSVIFYFNKDSIKKNIESAYYGGRMECIKLGTFNNCYKYDINSAYPNVIKDLREIISVKETKYNYNDKIKDENLYYISYTINSPQDLIGLLPYRHSSGMIFFPLSNKGWFYGCEIIEFMKYAEKYFIDFSIQKEIQVILGKKIFFTECIEDLFELRQVYKSVNDSKHYIYKIVLNSLYGKLAQKVGTQKFYNPYYAGYITSKTRAELLKVSLEHWNYIIFYATDGILSEKPLPIKNGENLGEWELIKIKEAIVLLSGVYKLTDENNKVYLGERGYKLDFDSVYNDIEKTGSSLLKQKLFVTYKYGLKNHIKYKDYIGQFVDIQKIINPIESNIKREYLFNKKINWKKPIESLLVDIRKVKQTEKFNFENGLIYED